MEREIYSIEFDSAIFTVDALKKAALTVVAHAVIDIRKSGANWVCSIEFLKAKDRLAAREFIDNFRIEVLDQDLRERIASETHAVRNLVLGLAFSKTGLQSSE